MLEASAFHALVAGRTLSLYPTCPYPTLHYPIPCAQMLEAGAFPVLLAGGGCAALCAGGLLDVGGEPDALAAAAGTAGWRSPDCAWRALQALPRLRQDALLVLLACPGAPASKRVSLTAASSSHPARPCRACARASGVRAPPATLPRAERDGRSSVASSKPTPVAEQRMSAASTSASPCSAHVPPTCPENESCCRGGHPAGRRGRAARPAGRDAAAAGAPGAVRGRARARAAPAAADARRARPRAVRAAAAAAPGPHA